MIAWLNFNDIMFGTTIETNREELISKYSSAPPPAERVDGIRWVKEQGFKTFITIEPIMDFDVDELSAMIRTANPNWINIGADSKGHNLPEPSGEKILALIENIRQSGIEIRNKSNLKRLLDN